MGMSFLGSKASLIASPTKTNRVSVIARVRNAVIPNQGACKLSLPCLSISPKDGEPGGNPKPKKSSDVSAIIELERINGRKVRVATIAFGRTCLIIIDVSETPRDFAALI